MKVCVGGRVDAAVRRAAVVAAARSVIVAVPLAFAAGV